MKWKDEDLSALRELECTVLESWRRQPDLTDYAAARAYEAAFQHYRARVRGHEPRPASLTGTDLELLNAILSVCEKLLASGATPLQGNPADNTSPLAVAKLAEYLRELQRSVQRHTQHGGRRGYFEFLAHYIP